MFVGDDWYDTKMERTDKKFKQVGVRIVYLHIKGTSSTKINNILNKFKNNIYVDEKI